MLLKLLKYIFKDFYIFTAAYSNDVFPEPLSKKEEEECVKKMLLGDKTARNKLIEHKLYIRENGMDMEEVRNWEYKNS